jgi:hypothetical protein
MATITPSTDNPVLETSGLAWTTLSPTEWDDNLNMTQWQEFTIDPRGSLIERGVQILSHSQVSENSSINEMFRFRPIPEPRGEVNHTTFLTSGWNIVRFRTDNPILVSSYKVWFSEDFNSGNRATTQFRLFGGMSPVNSEHVLLDDVIIKRPYHEKYGSQAICVTGDITPTLGQWFDLWFQGLSWGMSTDGPRVCGVQFT